MDDQQRPSPKGMVPRPPSLHLRAQRSGARYAVAAHLPKRHVPVDRAWCDTGTLFSLAHRPALLAEVMSLYGPSLVVTEAVADEVRRIARIPNARRTAENRLRCLSAERVVRALNGGQIRELPLSPSEGTYDKIDRILRQLDELEARQAKREVTPLDQIRSTRKHAGEAHSIVSAVRTVELGGTTVLLTNDGGASRVARQNGIDSKHVGHLLAELACADQELQADELLAQFEQVTANFATVPADARPKNSLFFVCHMTDGTCAECAFSQQ